jgi:hypothetical protein
LEPAPAAIIALIDLNEEFISVSSDLLVYLLKGENGHRLPEAFRKVLQIRLTTFRRRQVICPSCYFAAALGN